LGLAEMAAQDHSKAVEAFTKALENDPSLAEAYSNLGLLWQRAGQPEEAIQLFKKALEVNPKAADAYYNLGLAYELSHDLQKEIEVQKRALEACPDQVQTWIGGMRAFAKIADWPQADHLLSQVLSHVFLESEEALLSSVLYLLLSFPLAGRTLSAKHFHWGDCIERKLGQQKMETAGNFRIRSARGARIRIGYVSPDFGRHSVGWFFRNLSLRHDRERFEIHCYATDTRADDLTREIAQSVKTFRPVAGLDTTGLAGVIRADGIQILVDLAGHTRQNRLDVFALKPAPVQVTAFGYPHGTGLKTMDYRITDHFADGPEADEYYREKLVRMSAFFLPLGPLEYAPDTVTRSALGLPEQGTLLVSFNRPGKLRPEVLRLWDRILEKCPEAILAISCPFQSYVALRARIRSYFSETLNRNRVYFIESARKEEEHRSRYLLADLALDSFPYAGTTTSYEALYLNVPVITLAGENHVQRTTYSLLKHLGLEEAIAYSEAEYLEKAAALIQDPAFLKRTKLKLQQAMRAALGDSDFYVKELEQAYQIMWARYKQGEPAQVIVF
jgi:predicted O-linked N-acetylglucosamine transferase (SPINDLY family)